MVTFMETLDECIKHARIRMDRYVIWLFHHVLRSGNAS